MSCNSEALRFPRRSGSHRQPKEVVAGLYPVGGSFGSGLSSNARMIGDARMLIARYIGNTLGLLVPIKGLSILE